MKKILFLLGLGTLALSACKEKAPFILLTAPGEKVDTTYVVATVPAAEPHNILIENFTGATCSNCPSAHDLLHRLDSTYAGRLNIVSLYINNFSQTTPPPGARNDFRSAIATDIKTSVYQTIIAMPCAGIDRLPIGEAGTYGSNYLVGRNNWSTAIASHLATPTKMNLDIASNYDASTRKESVTLTVTFVETVTDTQDFSIAIVEDSIVDVQEFPDSFAAQYLFLDVLRQTATKTSMGDTLLPSIPIKEKGRVYQVTYVVPIDDKWIPAHCRIVAFVHGRSAKGSTTVYQSKQAKMVP